MNPIQVAFDHYRIQYYNDRAYIECLTVNKPVGTIVFLPDAQPLPPNSAPNGKPVLQYHLSSFNDIITILRYEKPLYLWFNADNLFASVGTTSEPIGEQKGV